MKNPVLIFEPADVMKILLHHSALTPSEIIDAVANYARVHHKEANADSTRFHETGLVICDLKRSTKKK